MSAETPTPTCPNLKQLFGKRYRVSYEESYYAERGTMLARTPDPWLMIIRGRLGHVFPHGRNLLAVATDKRGSTVTKLLAEVPDLTIVQNGSDGVNATFPIECFPAVARIVKLRKRRILTPEQLKALREHGFQRSENERQSDPSEKEHGDAP
jgi:hypothetical protein